jgi:hypothetical protein
MLCRLHPGKVPRDVGRVNSPLRLPSYRDTRETAIRSIPRNRDTHLLSKNTDVT